MSPAQIRDALAALSDRETVYFWHALPHPVRDALRDGLHAHLDQIVAAEEADLDAFFSEVAA